MVITLLSVFQVKLYVDGQAIQTDKDVVEVVDDWALHSSDKVHFEQLTVGGCWQGMYRTAHLINPLVKSMALCR